MRYGARATLHSAKARTDIGELPSEHRGVGFSYAQHVSQDDRSLAAFDVTGHTAREDHAGDGVDRRPRQLATKRRANGGGVAIGAGAGWSAEVAGSAVDASGDAAPGGIGRPDNGGGVEGAVD